MTEIEALAVIIHSYTIKVLTDHKSLLHLLKAKDFSSPMARRLLTIQDLMPDFAYIKGKYNVADNALSLNCALTSLVATQTSTFDALSHANLFTAQRNDPTQSKIIHYLESDDNSNLPQVSSLLQYFLYKVITFTGKHESSHLTHQLAITQTIIQSVVELIHDTPHASHPDKDKSLSQARLKFFCLTMRKDINAYIDVCHICTRTKGDIHAHVPSLVAVKVNLIKLHT